MTKTCSKCHAVKDLDQFGKDARHSSGRQSQCRVCQNEANTRRREANPEKAREADRKYAAAHREEKREYDNQRRQHLAKSNPSCVIDGCDRPMIVFRSGLCSMHKTRVLRDGDAGEAESRFGRSPQLCSAEGCDRSSISNGYCGMHDQRTRKHGDPSVVLISHPINLKGEDSPNWLGDDVTYIAVHARLRKMRGKASEYQCPCGRQAQDWSYNNDDPNELISLSKHSFGMRYSTDLDRYEALCKPCHKQKDLAVAA